MAHIVTRPWFIYKNKNMNSRRSFIRQAGVMAGTSLLAATLQQKAFAFGKKMAANDRINVAAVGINGMGWADLLSSLKQPGVQVVMLCDTDKNVLDKRMADLAKLNVDVSKIKTTGDYHQVLNNK